MTYEDIDIADLEGKTIAFVDNTHADPETGSGEIVLYFTDDSNAILLTQTKKPRFVKVAQGDSIPAGNV